MSADVWPLHDNADPLNGWPLKDVDATPSGPATADIYGKLFYYVCDILRSFLQRLSGIRSNFRLLQADALELPDFFDSDESFNRIEVCKLLRPELATTRY